MKMKMMIKLGFVDSMTGDPLILILPPRRGGSPLVFNLRTTNHEQRA